MIDARKRVLLLSTALDKYISHLESENRRLNALIDDIRGYDRDSIIRGIASHQSESGR